MPTAWTSGRNISMEYTEYQSMLAVTNDDGWGWMYREVTLKATDYIRFAAKGTFKVEIGSKDSTYGTVIIPEKTYEGETVIVPVPSDVVTKNGEYKIYLYIVGEKDVQQTITEFFIIESETEDVPSYGNGMERIVCGKKKENE